ncbi:hypothetical protein [Micromonospora polyrhachis]|uniref:Uncharacterized protein n=1 Tax=Micromonospora polyrhachis TaxID=1282883 RepID=A0A7W7SUN9_9ACTN|nr:hypothetical protein [Micromonospora polyrhachis]MBB4960627.1 hypothetical protein [Micromonospora polyrhachis]
MATKRKSRTTPRNSGTGASTSVPQPELSELKLPVPVDLSVPVDLPSVGDEPTAGRITPKAGPSRRSRGGIPGSVRNSNIGRSRQYAFRRS